jgi:hypothetical protein
LGERGYDEQVVDLKPGFNERMEADPCKLIATYQQRLESEKDAFVRQDLEILVDAAQLELEGRRLEDKYLVGGAVPIES